MSENISATAAVSRFIKVHPSAVGYLIPLVGALEKSPVLVRACPDGLVKMTDDAVDPMVLQDIDKSIEIRLFDKKTELRWMSIQGSSGGDYVTWDAAAAEKRNLHCLPRCSRKLLWGHVDAVRGTDWVRLSDARVGSFWAPITVGSPPQNLKKKKKWYVAFRTQEYLAQDEHGNWYVADERYLGIEALPAHAVEIKLNDKVEE